MALVFRGCPGSHLPGRVEGDAMPVAFLDRDGVLNIDHGYVFEVEKFEWLANAREAIGLLHGSGRRVVVLTNQSGIGRGYYSETQFLELTAWMIEQARFDAVCYCPHAPEENCPARKPGTAMFEAVEKVFKVEKSGSFFVGDKESDMLAAAAYGIPGIRCESNDLADCLKSLGL